MLSVGIFKKSLLITSAFCLIHLTGKCCTTCNEELQRNLYNEKFLPNLLSLFSAFIVLAVIVAVLIYIHRAKHKTFIENHKASEYYTPVPLTSASIILGIGLGGFLDGIILHQLLQWHEMLSAKIPPITWMTKSINMFWDGIFHLFTLIVVLIGVIKLWQVMKRRDADRSGRLLAGGLITGWAIFNLVEGIIDHQILHLHNVREITANPPLWNYGFLFASVLMLIIGIIMLAAKPKMRRQSKGMRLTH